MSIYNLTPINKTAATVTSQSGCASDDTLTNEQVRENLVLKVKGLEKRILELPKNSRQRKILGHEKSKLQKEISAIRKKRSCKAANQFVLDVLRSEVSEFQFKRILHKASLMAVEHQKNIDESGDL